MSFLLAKIFILLLLAATLGALLARWWLLRQYEDVTTEYTRLSDETQRWRDGLEDRLEQRLVQRLGVDLEPVMVSLQSVRAAVQGIHIPGPTAMDLSPVLLQVQQLEARLMSLHKPDAGTPAELAPVHMQMNLDPLLQRLDAIEDALRQTQDRLGQLTSMAQQPTALLAQQVTPHTSATVRAGSSNLLMQASYGRADNLKLIKGVASVLEKMLHGIGVYYFWQIADWTPEDIAHADAQLNAFKGRILRDDWKSQATQFAQAPDAARKPEGF